MLLSKLPIQLLDKENKFILKGLNPAEYLETKDAEVIPTKLITICFKQYYK